MGRIQDFDFRQVKEICRDLLQLLKLFWGAHVGTKLEFLVFSWQPLYGISGIT